MYYFDESCLRMYLRFTPDLRKLLEDWAIAHQGRDAFRPEFCSRKLLSEFVPVRLPSGDVVLETSFVNRCG